MGLLSTQVVCRSELKARGAKGVLEAIMTPLSCYRNLCILAPLFGLIVVVVVMGRSCIKAGRGRGVYVRLHWFRHGSLAEVSIVIVIVGVRTWSMNISHRGKDGGGGGWSVCMRVFRKHRQV